MARIEMIHDTCGFALMIFVDRILSNSYGRLERVQSELAIHVRPCRKSEEVKLAEVESGYVLIIGIAFNILVLGCTLVDVTSDLPSTGNGGHLLYRLQEYGHDSATIFAQFPHPLPARRSLSRIPPINLESLACDSAV